MFNADAGVNATADFTVIWDDIIDFKADIRGKAPTADLRPFYSLISGQQNASYFYSIT
jgi:hypothetical protein